MAQTSRHDDQPSSQEETRNSILRFLSALREDYNATLLEDGRYTYDDIKIAHDRIEQMYLDYDFAREELLKQAGKMLLLGDIDADLFRIISREATYDYDRESSTSVRSEKTKSFDTAMLYAQTLADVVEPLLKSGEPISDSLMQAARARTQSLPKDERRELKIALGSQALARKIDERYILISFGNDEYAYFKNVQFLCSALHLDLEKYDTYNLVKMYRELATWFASGAPQALDQEAAQDILFKAQPALKKIYDETQEKLAKARAQKRKTADLKKEVEELEKKLGLLDGEGAKQLATSFMMWGAKKLHDLLTSIIAYKDSLEVVELQQSIIRESLEKSSLQFELDRLPSLEELSMDIKGLQAKIDAMWTDERPALTDDTVTDYVSKILRAYDEQQELYGTIEEVRAAKPKVPEKPYTPSGAHKVLETVYGRQAKIIAEEAEAKREAGATGKAARLERTIPRFENLQLLYSAAGAARDASNELLAQSKEQSILETRAKSLREQSIQELKRAEKYESLVDVYMNLSNIEERWSRGDERGLYRYIDKVSEKLESVTGTIIPRADGKNIPECIQAIKSVIDSILWEAEEYRASRHSS